MELLFMRQGCRLVPVLHNYSGLIPWVTKAVHEGNSQLLHHRTSRRIGKEQIKFLVAPSGMVETPRL